MNYIDHIYIINLAHRTDRWDKCIDQLTKYKIKNYTQFQAIRPEALDTQPIHYYNTMSNQTNEKYIIGALGCKLSHLAVIKDAKQKQYKSILILEDDFLLTTNFLNKLTISLHNITKMHKTNTMCYLGFGRGKVNPTNMHHIVKLDGVLTTHAYILYSPFYDTVINALEKSSCEIDICYSDLQKQYKIYGVFPVLVTQRRDFSDIQNTRVSY